MKKLVYSFFLITVLSCTNTQSKTGLQAVKNERQISQIDIKDIPFDFDKKNLKEIKDSFKFLRSFVSYFYELVFKNADVLKSYQNLNSFRGLMVGDAHIENFGYLLDDKNQALFTVNDFDDFGKGPVYLDLLRFSLGVQLYSLSGVDAGAVYDYYVKGLKDKSIEVPSILEKLRDDSIAKGVKVKKTIAEDKNLSSKGGEKLTNSEKKSLTSYITVKYPKAKILDSAQLTKSSGGSAGMIRYQVLIEIKSKLFHLEFKEQAESSVKVTQTKDENMTVKQKVNSAFDFYLADKRSTFYDFAVINDKKMLVRPKFKGDLGVDLSFLKPNQIEKIVLYEAWLLGQLHKKNQNLDIKNYLKDLDHSFQDYLNDINDLKIFFDKKFSDVNG